MIKVASGIMVPLTEPFSNFTPGLPGEPGLDGEDTDTANWVSQCIDPAELGLDPAADLVSGLWCLVNSESLPEGLPERLPEGLPGGLPGGLPEGGVEQDQSKAEELLSSGVVERPSQPATPISVPASPASSDSSYHHRSSDSMPRHKRASHKRAELKRRDKIKNRLDDLKAEVPSIADKGRMSEVAILAKAADFAKHLKGDCERYTTEAGNLRRQIESLSTEIHQFQEHLPAAGLKPEGTETEDLPMDQRYENLVAERTKESWKYYLFNYFMKPLFQSYKTATASSDPESLVPAVDKWADDRLGLSTLRPHSLSVLRDICKSTDIMSHPESLQQQALTSVGKTLPDTPTSTTSTLAPNATPAPAQLQAAATFQLPSSVSRSPAQPQAAAPFQLPSSISRTPAQPQAAAPFQLPSSVSRSPAQPQSAATFQIPSSVSRTPAQPQSAATFQIPSSVSRTPGGVKESRVARVRVTRARSPKLSTISPVNHVPTATVLPVPSQAAASHVAVSSARNFVTPTSAFSHQSHLPILPKNLLPKTNFALANNDQPMSVGVAVRSATQAVVPMVTASSSAQQPMTINGPPMNFGMIMSSAPQTAVPMVTTSSPAQQPMTINGSPMNFGMIMSSAAQTAVPMVTTSSPAQQTMTSNGQPMLFSMIMSSAPQAVVPMVNASSSAQQPMTSNGQPMSFGTIMSSTSQAAVPMVMASLPAQQPIRVSMSSASQAVVPMVMASSSAQQPMRVGIMSSTSQAVVPMMTPSSAAQQTMTSNAQPMSVGMIMSSAPQDVPMVTAPSPAQQPMTTMSGCLADIALLAASVGEATLTGARPTSVTAPTMSFMSDLGAEPNLAKFTINGSNDFHLYDFDIADIPLLDFPENAIPSPQPAFSGASPFSGLSTIEAFPHPHPNPHHPAPTRTVSFTPASTSGATSASGLSTIWS